MDIFTTLVQTAKKLGLSAYAYLRDRLSRRFELPSLAQSIRAAIEAATTQPLAFEKIRMTCPSAARGMVSGETR